METRRKHYVTFWSPGTFVSELSSLPVEEWDCRKACELAKGITERHGAKPYAFQFETRLEADPVDDGQGGTMRIQPKEIAKSGMHFLGGVVLTIEDIEARNDGKNNILISNMRCNDFPIVCENRNSFLSTHPFREGDFVMNKETGEIVERGDTQERKAYRKRKADERAAELASYRQ